MDIIKIELLQKHPEHINTVIDWLNTEFGNEHSKNFYKDIVLHSLEEEKFPISFVAIENGVLLGTVSIWRGDLLSRQDLFPWLSALVVNVDYRNKGIGKRLQDYVLNYCKRRGYLELFLYTDITNYYEKNGWKTLCKGYEYTGNKVNIYRYTL